MYFAAPRSFNDVPDDKAIYRPEELPQLQAKMLAVQKLGSSINQLQQKDDYEGAMALYRQAYPCRPLTDRVITASFTPPACTSSLLHTSSTS